MASNPKVERMREAAKKGIKQAQLDLALCYLRGDMMEKNQVNGVRWLRKASIGNSPLPQAQVEYAYCLRNGIGCEVDIDQAKEMAKLAAARGHPGASQLLADLNRLRKDKDGCWVVPDRPAPAGRVSAAPPPARRRFSSPPPRRPSRGPPRGRIPRRPSKPVVSAGNPSAGPSSKTQPTTPVEIMREAAREGHVRAQFDLGMAYLEGRLLEKNAINGVRWLRKASTGSKAMPRAMYEYALCQKRGQGCEVNIDEALKFAKLAHDKMYGPAADLLKELKSIRKDADGCYIIPKDSFSASVSATAPVAAPQHRPPVQQQPAQPVQPAKPVQPVQPAKPVQQTQPVQQPEPTQPVQQPSKTPNYAKMFVEGMSCMGGLYPNRTAEEGFALLEECAEGGHGGACFQVARCLMQGNGCTKNIGRARQWANKAVAAGFNRAHDLLKEMENMEDDVIPPMELLGPLMEGPDRYILSFQIAVQEPVPPPVLESRMIEAFSVFGPSNARFIVGVLFLFGSFGFPQDPKRATELFEQASAENVSAMHNLAILYLTGAGVPHNVPKGMSLLQKAAETGSPLSALILAHCVKSGTGVARDGSRASVLRSMYKQPLGVGMESMIERLLAQISTRST